SSRAAAAHEGELPLRKRPASRPNRCRQRSRRSLPRPYLASAARREAARPTRTPRVDGSMTGQWRRLRGAEASHHVRAEPRVKRMTFMRSSAKLAPTEATAFMRRNYVRLDRSLVELSAFTAVEP